MNKELRVIHAEMLIELAEQHDDVMVLEADLMGSMSTRKFADAFPNNFLQCGIAEANMIGVAAGLAAVGKVPFVHSFGCFATRRCYDQIFLAGGYAKQHINIFGSDAGVTAVTNGGTHMPFEDTGLMRLVPNATVIDVSDEHVLRAAMRYAYNNKGVNYIRSTRKDLPHLHQSEADIEIGKGNVLKDGETITLIASGICVHDAMQAANMIEAQTGHSVAVIDMHTIKPLDSELVAKFAAKTGCVITIENHNVIGGLGDAVACELLSSGVAVKQFHKLGVQEQYGQVGSLDFLKETYGISATKITEFCLEVLNKR
ncbi:transketolase C-terminal domain-containing protein [Vibrio scophthalmi]|uniref:Transketolase, C-terminal domain-containing protein n=2 Tax=Vibrio TaxID=662 RepID=F9S2R8_9VIBR|nr:MULTISPECIES: transketolase C-terminal domain-containing protein [Vibrio]ANS84861.1 Transketolase [Vibrio scophthalmi]EGU30332.1 transketolase, C-terminal domain protein [Vibrio sp. N418]EGU38842.1 transketolase, C-terminal domain-containing protein [Vibrio ichthyoenteri ATCC 700023]MCY9802172.1 transketolase family protein [Vibrio scophthalmi]ODS11978.1 Transketolase [Vibrio scophthalmi]